MLLELQLEMIVGTVISNAIPSETKDQSVPSQSRNLRVRNTASKMLALSEEKFENELVLESMFVHYLHF